MRIPEEMYNTDVVYKPDFTGLAPSIRDFIKGCDLVGYNLLKFDIPLFITLSHL
ncbi:MAG: hypothetical protein LBE13_22830 [Bacteroidales bacterium]|jgi:DNA polymerase-3 subunit epsilon|nr:hypothetical protein [Bacteroidales bacterium]